MPLSFKLLTRNEQRGAEPGGAAGEGQGGQLPPPPPDLLSQTNQVWVWICLLYTQLFWLYSDLQSSAIFILEVDFLEPYPMTSAVNNVSEPPNLKIFWGRIPPDPPTRLMPLELTIMHPPPPLLQKTELGPRTSMSCTTASDGVTW